MLNNLHTQASPSRSPTISHPEMPIGLRLRNLVPEAVPSCDLTRLFLSLSFSVVNSHQVAKARNVIFQVSLKTLHPFNQPAGEAQHRALASGVHSCQIPLVHGAGYRVIRVDGPHVFLRDEMAGNHRLSPCVSCVYCSRSLITIRITLLCLFHF